MLITFDTDSLNNLKLTAEDYTWLLIIADNKQGLLKKYVQDMAITDIEIYNKLRHLGDIGLVELVSGDSSNVLNWQATKKAKELLYGDDLFKIFLAESSTVIVIGVSMFAKEKEIRYSLNSLIT